MRLLLIPTSRLFSWGHLAILGSSLTQNPRQLPARSCSFLPTSGAQEAWTSRLSFKCRHVLIHTLHSTWRALISPGTKSLTGCMGLFKPQEAQIKYAKWSPWSSAQWSWGEGKTPTFTPSAGGRILTPSDNLLQKNLPTPSILGLYSFNCFVFQMGWGMKLAKLVLVLHINLVSPTIF